jgi:hypothetical protein
MAYVVGCFNTIDTGHANVQQNDVRVYLCRYRESFFTIGRLTDDLVVAKVVYELPQPVTRGLLVVDDQYSHIRLSCGNRNLTA